MPLFFIDSSDGDNNVIDDEGLELPDVHAARRAALAALPDMARDQIPNGDHRAISVAVRDASGRAVYEASLVLSGRWFFN